MYDGRGTYDFEAALTDAAERPRQIGPERVYDKRAADAPERETSCWATIVGLFDGGQCRRCESRFDALTEESDWRSGHDGEVLAGKESHRLWHEWKDENQSALTEDDLSCFAVCEPLKGYVPDAGNRVLELAPPTAAQLKRHREKFEPQGKTVADARCKHRAACDEIAALYNLSGDDVERMLHDLRSEGLSVPEIAERCGVPEAKVRMIVRGGRKRGSGARRTGSRSA